MLIANGKRNVFKWLIGDGYIEWTNIRFEFLQKSSSGEKANKVLFYYIIFTILLLLQQIYRIDPIHGSNMKFFISILI